MLPEALLIEQARARSLPAWSEIYARHFDQIYKYVYFRVRDPEAAEDISSDVFVKAFERADRINQDGAPIVAWLYRIARNAAFDHLRHRVVRQRVEAPGVEARSADDAEGVADRLDTLSALARLSLEQQEVLQLRFIQGVPTEQVARVIGKSEAAVKSIQVRALQELRRQLGVAARRVVTPEGQGI